MATVDLDLTDQVDGVRTSFTSHRTWVAGSLRVYIDGQMMRGGAENDFIETGVDSFSVLRTVWFGSTLQIRFETILASDFPIVVASGTDPTVT